MHTTVYIAIITLSVRKYVLYHYPPKKKKYIRKIQSQEIFVKTVFIHQNMKKNHFINFSWYLCSMAFSAFTRYHLRNRSAPAVNC